METVKNCGGIKLIETKPKKATKKSTASSKGQKGKGTKNK